MTFDIEYVPENYIAQIYARLAETQKTAKDIYIEMLKQKAKKIKKIALIPHHEALEIAAKTVGFKNFKEALSTSEANARYAILQEHRKKEQALKNGYNRIEKEYQQYLAGN